MKELLRSHIEKTVQLSDEEYAEVFSYFTHANFKRNEFVFEQGGYVKHIYFVLSGLLKLTFIDSSANQYILSFAMEDWWESDFCAFFRQIKATMSLQCLEKTEVLCLSLDNYNVICERVPKMRSFFLHKSNNGFIESQQRILSLLTASAKERYDMLLAQSPTLFQRVSKTQLAAFLGVSRETLSRL